MDIGWLFRLFDNNKHFWSVILKETGHFIKANTSESPFHEGSKNTSEVSRKTFQGMINPSGLSNIYYIGLYKYCPDSLEFLRVLWTKTHLRYQATQMYFYIYIYKYVLFF